MDTYRLQQLLFYAAVPFAIIAVWAWLQPATFPRWAYSAALCTTLALSFLRYALQKKRKKAHSKSLSTATAG
jgi:hypothetical protein